MIATTSSFVEVRQLIAVRSFAVAAQLAAVGVTDVLLGITLPLVPMLSIIAALAGFNVGVWLHLRPDYRVHPWTACAHLSADVVALSALLYFSGGATNPFATMFLLLLALAAILLPVVQTGLVAVLTIIAYSVLLMFYWPLQWPGPASDAFLLHVAGMWLAFVLSAAVVTVFVAALSQRLHARKREIELQRERALRDREIFTLGSLAATTAHEIGNPLATIKLLALEMAEDQAHGLEGNEASQRLQALRTEVDRCSAALQRLTAAAEGLGGARSEAVPVDRILSTLLERLRDQHPDVPVTSTWDGPNSRAAIRDDGTLSRAIYNILDNAADASPEGFRIEARCAEQHLELTVTDRGPGLSPTTRPTAGSRPSSDKPDGLGLGLFLTRRVIEHLDGRLWLSEHPDGGLKAVIRLPLEIRHGAGG